VVSQDAVDRCGFVVSEAPPSMGEERLFVAVEPQERKAPNVAQGTVKWFNDDKDYGSIYPRQEGHAGG
jgi:hypothetical protein